MSFLIATEGLRTVRTNAQAESIIYVRNGGDNDNDGTLANPLLTLEEAVSRLRSGPAGRLRQVINLTGFVDTITTATQIDTPTGKDGGNNNGRAGGFDNGKLDVFNYPLELIADPLLVQAITINSQVQDSVTDLVTLTVDEVLTPNAHVGEWVDGGLTVIGVIHSNTANTITIASTLGGSFAANAFIYTQSCVLTSAVNSPLRFIAQGDFLMSGIKVQGTDPLFGVNISMTGKVYIQQCNFEGCNVSRNEGGSGLVTMFWSYVHTTGWFMDGVATSVNDCVFKDVNLASHGGGGYGANEYKNSIFDGCSAIGGGNWESSVDIEVNNCLVVNGTASGVQKASASRCTVSDSRINDCAGSGVLADTGGGTLLFRRMAGTGNSRYGLEIKNNVNVQLETVTTITGDLGDILLGGDRVLDWSDAPASHSTAFCRIAAVGELAPDINKKNAAITLAAAATTFVKTSSCMSVTGDVGANTVATITGAESGDELDLIFRDGLVTITDDDTASADTISLSVAFTGSDRDLLTLKYDGTSWYEKSRSLN